MSSKKWTHRPVEAPRLRILIDPVLQKRFFAKVFKNSVTGCHNGQGAGDRYGNFGWRVDGKDLQISAHYVAFIIANGREPEGEVLRHTCDNGLCVNPEHLIEGSQKDNIHDKLSRGRHPSRYITRKTSDEEVRKIRHALTEPYGSQEELAKRFGCSRSKINHIKLGTRYADVA